MRRKKSNKPTTNLARSEIGNGLYTKTHQLLEKLSKNQPVAFLVVLIGVILTAVATLFTAIWAIASVIQTIYVVEDHNPKKPSNVPITEIGTDDQPFNKQTTLSNLLSCLGNTGGEQRHIQLSWCLDGVSLPATTTAQQIIDILGTIPRDSIQWHDDLVDLLKNNKITISGEDATRLLSTFGSESRRSYLIGILCYIKRPISDSDKNELLKGIDPMYVSYVRQQLAEPTNLPCEN